MSVSLSCCMCVCLCVSLVVCVYVCVSVLLYVCVSLSECVYVCMASQPIGWFMPGVVWWWTEPSISTDLGSHEYQYDDVRKVQSSKHILVWRHDRRSCCLASFLICGASFSLPRFEPDCFRILGSSLCREIASQFCRRLELTVCWAECHISSN